MNYFLYKLRFSTPVHFGASDAALGLLTSEDHFCADTLFSALCHGALRQGEDPQLLIRLVREGFLKLSDSMPWQGDTFFLPRPILRIQREQELPAEQRKTMKKLRWVPVAPSLTEYREPVSFGSSFVRAQTQVPGEGDALPYEVGLYSFRENCGLWFIAGLGDLELEAPLTSLVTALGLDGIGGRTSSGFGKFTVEDVVYLNEPFDEQTELLYQDLSDAAAPLQLMLTTALPRNEELETALEGAFYQVTRRGGFVQSESFHDVPLKKRTQYFLTAGSVTARRFRGDLFPVDTYGAHPVYRYGVPLFMGVKA